MEAHFADDPEAQAWAQDLPADDFQSLIDRASTHPPGSDAPR
jgi:hypothetical protein